MRNSSGNRNHGEGVFREWLSDHLRYLILLLALFIAVMAISMFSRLIDQNRSRYDRNVSDAGAAAEVKSGRETEEAIVILSSEGNAAEEAADEAAAKKQTETAAASQTEAVTEKQTEKAAMSQTEAATEKQTEAAEADTEAATEEQTEKAAEAQTEAVTEKQTETAAETEAAAEAQTEAAVKKQPETAAKTETEAVTEKQTEAAAEKQTEAAAEKQTEAAAEKQTEAAAEKQTEAAAEKQTEKAEAAETEAATEKHTGNITTSSTERTVHAGADSKKPVTSATLAGIGSEEQETESESSVKTGSITVSSVSGLRNASRTPMLVSGGSSTSGNRASVTNIDTGNTIGTYRRVADTGNATISVPDENTAADSDYSGGLLETAGSTDNGSGSYDGGGQEVVSVAEPAPQPEYRTIISACNIRSYPDYGDNVIGSLGGGESVLFYGLEEGWDKIEYNGIVGYIGPKFLQ